ncbi:MAG: NBR1-Ig-like domain-containing protein [Blastocatellia bacterium]
MKGLISKPALQAFAVLLAALFLADTGRATTAIMLSDEELIVSSRVILLGEVVSTKAQWDLNHDNINTYVKVKVSKVLKGQLQNEHIVFRQLGGVVGEESTVIFGAPEYKAGRRVLLFLDTARDGTLRVAHLFQGKYDVVDDSRAARVERKVDKGAINLLGASEGSDITNTSTLARFTKKIKRVLRARAADVSALDAEKDQPLIVETPPEYVDDAAQGAPEADVTPQYTFLGSYRWFEPDTGQPVVYRVNPAASPIAGGGTSEINQAFAAWTNVTTTALVLQNGGSTTMFGFRQDGVSTISYDDPLDQMSDPVGCSGTLALGGVTSAGGGTRVIGGLTFSHIFEGDVVFNRNFACFLGVSSNLAEVATHEIGHSIGFGHSADPAATMYATAHGGGRGATLGSDDVAAVTFLYPGSKGAPPPAPPTAPGGLSAFAASSSAINLTWVDNSNNEDGFRLERKTGAGGVYAPIAAPAAGQVSYSDSGLSPSTTYYYRIKAYNTAGESAYSAESSATTSPAATSNNAAFVSQSVPAALGAGQSAAVSITMRNTGTSTWVAGTYFLGSQNPQGNTTWGLSRVNLATSVAPGSDATFSFNVTAPSTAGSYNFQWGMLQNATFFGGLSANVPITVTSGGGGGTSDNAAFVSQFVPTSMTPGQIYSVTVTMRNTGTSTWSPSTGYRLGSQSPQDNLTWGTNRVSLLSSVAPGASISIKFTVRAPSTSGVYNFQWQMVKDGAGFFGGPTQNVAIQVGSGGGGATNGASFVSQIVPSSLGAGQAAFVSVTMRNSGTTTWTPGTYFLGSQNPQDNTMWGLSRVNLTSSVAPGSDATFTFNVTAPSTAGSYNFQWGMLQSGVGYFGFASANVAVAVGGGGGGGINDATFVSQNVPASMSAGQTYTASVTMRNSGSTTWAAGAYKLTSQNPASNLTWGVNQLSLPASVAPGSDATFSFSVTAPSTAGTYGFQWRMFQDGVGYFGAFTPGVGVSVSSTAPPAGSPVITTTSIAYGTRGVLYSQQLSAQGGSPPYQWAVTAGSLPPGLLLNGGTGLISGTPTVGGTFTFTVTVTDRNGSRASQGYKSFIR